MATAPVTPATERAHTGSRTDLVGAVLLVVAASQLLPGVLAMVAPAAFYDAFAAFPPENHHFIRDVGSWQVALGLVALLAWWRPAIRVPVLAILALQYGLHLVSHVIDVDASDPEWHGVFGLATEALGTVVLTAIAVKEARK